MNAGSQSCFCKGAVLNPKHAALSVAVMGQAARLFRFVTVRGSRNVGALAAQQSSPLLGFRLLGRNATQPCLANLFPRFRRSNVMAVQPCVATAVMFLRCQAFKVFRAIVGLITIDVMHLLVGVKRLQPASGHDTVHQALTTQAQVSSGVFGGRVWLELSESFSAARNGVNVVEKSVLDSVYFYAEHAVPQGG
tara:strand:- start:141 stop:719 length:579 start_codon:yes stop_codon:yes gene_type:complete